MSDLDETRPQRKTDKRARTVSLPLLDDAARGGIHRLGFQAQHLAAKAA
jgi:hypothetical protein